MAQPDAVPGSASGPAIEAERRICVGVITAPHGLAGQVRIRSFTADPADVGGYGPLTDKSGSRSFHLTVTGGVRGQVIARIDDIEDRTAAEALRGQRLYLDRRALPEPSEDEYYHADLIGMTAELAANGNDRRPLGRIRAVHDFGAGAVLEIDGGPCGSVMVPFTRDAVPDVDAAGKRVTVSSIDGLVGPAADDAGSGGSEA